MFQTWCISTQEQIGKTGCVLLRTEAVDVSALETVHPSLLPIANLEHGPSLVLRTRSFCPSAATMLSMLEFKKYQHRMMIVKDGQMEDISLTHVLSVQTSWRFRRCGDPRRQELRFATFQVDTLAQVPSIVTRPTLHRSVVVTGCFVKDVPRRILLISLRIEGRA